MKKIIRLFYYFAVVFVVHLSLFAQSDSTNVEVADGYIFSKGEVMITLENSYFRIAKAEEVFFDQSIPGLKQVDFSRDQDYMLITSFDFPESEENYKIYLFLFNNDFELVDKAEIDAFYGMPHPLFRVNNEGVISYIDPLTMRLEIRDGGKQNSVELEKGIPFEMERQLYIETDDERVYVLYNREIIPIEDRNPIFTLAKYGISSSELVKREVEISSVTYCGLTEEGLIISGVKFEESIPVPLSLRFNENLEVLSETKEINFERLEKHDDFLVGTFNKSLVVFNEYFEKKSEKYLTGEGKFKRVFDLGGKLGIMIEAEGMLMIYTATNENVEFDENLPHAILSFSNFERFVNIKECYIHSNNQTFIIK
ncbi:MAG: hypothetical protein AB9882_09155 [Ignavibacteriaceae bacterium]